jgi:hypothetical protein
MSSIVPIIVLVAAAILLLGYGVYLQVTRRRTILAERLETYASIEAETGSASAVFAHDIRARVHVSGGGKSGAG